MNLGPSVWGPHAWKFIHITAMAYPENPTNIDINTYRNFFTLLGDILPCPTCRINYKKKLIKFPLTDFVLASTDNLVKWTIDLHNEVNKDTGKEQYDYETSLNFLKTIEPFEPQKIEHFEPQKIEHFEPQKIQEIPIYTKETINKPKYEPKIEIESNNILWIILMITIIIIFGSYYIYKTRL
jgi:hypothetical protein